MEIESPPEVSGDAQGVPACLLERESGLLSHVVVCSAECKLNHTRASCGFWEVCEKDYASLIQFFGGVESMVKLTLPC